MASSLAGSNHRIVLKRTDTFDKFNNFKAKTTQRIIPGRARKQPHFADT
jgi:hypothetical protein